MTRREKRLAQLRARPEAMRLFGWFVFASVAFNCLAILGYLRRFQTDATAQGTLRAGWLVAIVILIIMYGLFWWRIAMRGGNVARWLYIPSVIMSLRQIPHVYAVTLDYGLPYGVLMAASLSLALAGAALLLRRDISHWLRSGGRGNAIDTGIFK